MDDESITLDDLICAARRRWGGEHIVVGETTDGIQHVVWLFVERERGQLLHELASAGSRAELLRIIEAGEPAAATEQ
jgi:hypothetical protein